MKPGKPLSPALLAALVLSAPATAQEAAEAQAGAPSSAASSSAPAAAEIRDELEQLKRINLQLMRRIQVLESISPLCVGLRISNKEMWFV